MTVDEGLAEDVLTVVEVVLRLIVLFTTGGVYVEVHVVVQPCVVSVVVVSGTYDAKEMTSVAFSWLCRVSNSVRNAFSVQIFLHGRSRPWRRRQRPSFGDRAQIRTFGGRAVWRGWQNVILCGCRSGEADSRRCRWLGSKSRRRRLNILARYCHSRHWLNLESISGNRSVLVGSDVGIWKVVGKHEVVCASVKIVPGFATLDFIIFDGLGVSYRRRLQDITLDSPRFARLTQVWGEGGGRRCCCVARVEESASVPRRSGTLQEVASRCPRPICIVPEDASGRKQGRVGWLDVVGWSSSNAQTRRRCCDERAGRSHYERLRE